MATYKLTIVNENPEMGTITGEGTYEKTETYTDDKKWEFRKYAKGATIPELKNYGDNVSYSSKTTYNDSQINVSMAIGDNYTARCTTWVYFSNNYTWKGTIGSDDASNWYLDGKLVKTLDSYQTGVSATFNFHAGWNKFQVVYTEGTGGDGWAMSPLLSSVAEKMSSNYSGHPAEANIIATPKSNHVFVGCFDQNNNIVLSKSGKLILNSDLTLYGKFGTNCIILK